MPLDKGKHEPSKTNSPNLVICFLLKLRITDQRENNRKKSTTEGEQFMSKKKSGEMHISVFWNSEIPKYMGQ